MGRRGSSACPGATMRAMTAPSRRRRAARARSGALAVLIAWILASSLWACGPNTTGSPSPERTADATTVPVETGVTSGVTSGVASAGPGEPTPVPVVGTPAVTGEPEPVPTQAGTTDTAWGTILDAVPAEWPVYPGARPVESDAGPASGAWLAPDDATAVASWYRDTLADQAYTIENLSSPLEDGTRILDIVTDLPECRIQATFRPAEGSTMITVLYGAGCAGGDG
jgi:hypothetical protein